MHDFAIEDALRRDGLPAILARLGAALERALATLP